MSTQIIRYGIYAAAISLILTLTGIFRSFERNDVISGVMTLSTVVLLLMVGLTGYVTGWVNRERGLVGAGIGGAIGGLIVGAALALLVLFSANVSMTFVFPNMGNLAQSTLMLGQPDLATGLLLLLVVSIVSGLAGGLLSQVRARERNILMIGVSMTLVMGLLQQQIFRIITPAYAIVLLIAFGMAYFVNLRLVTNAGVPVRTLIGGVAGLAVGVAAYSTLGSDVSLLPFRPTGPLMWLALGLLVFSAGSMGALSASASREVNSVILYFIMGVVVLAVINWQGRMTLLASALTFVLLIVPLWFAPYLKTVAEQRFSQISRQDRKATSRFVGFFALAIMFVLPLFVGQYITSVLDLVGLYIIMGIGLNVMVGYTGLLDLGFVASFAIGAYSIGLFTTPSMLTCGGLPPSAVTSATVAELCPGIMTFWQAWPLAALTAGLTGALLGVPVLRLRGDYLAIVTLGFGEIINRIAQSSTFRDLLGGPQGISPIPGPVIDLRGMGIDVFIELGTAMNIYYLILISVLVVAFIVYRLANTRLGRAWRSIRADEDVAEAMGIHLVRNKLLAFGISSTLAGVGGAIYGSWLQGIFPNSFTLLVSINVLSLIIIGGLGSIPGVVVGSLMLIGLPEILRELQDYRLLVFGVLLVITMILKPEGLIPPPVRRLAEGLEDEAPDARAVRQEGAQHG